MSESVPPDAIGKKLAVQSPWVLIAALLHVAAIAVASILYYAHESAVDDGPPTEISLSARPAPELFAPPLEIMDRLKEVPRIQDVDLRVDTNVELRFDATDEPDPGVESDEAVQQIAALPGDPGGATSIGPGLVGHRAPGPSALSGVPKGYGDRPGHGGKGDGPGGPCGGIENEVQHGLDWLAAHQDESGRWDTEKFMKHDPENDRCDGPGNPVHDVGVTGLALLAFLGNGHTMRDGRFRGVVRRGVKWLVEQQDENGRIGPDAAQTFMYSHSIATVALCEAYGLSDKRRTLQGPCQKAVNYIVNARSPYGVWRYQPRDLDGDTSVTGWMVQALLSAKAFGFAVDNAALAASTDWFDRVTDPATGAAGYTRAGEGSSRPIGKQDKFPANKTEALTAVVLLCRYLMHEDPKDSKTMRPAADTILAKPPVWNTADGSIDMYYWYYGSYAMYQADGKYWSEWSKKLTQAAVKTQRQDGRSKGSWDPVDVWGQEGGRVYSTAMMVLCLEAYYRYGRVSFAR